MEVKLSTRHRPPDLRPPELRRSLFQSSPNLPFYSFCPKSWENGEWSFQKRLRGTVKKWRLHLQEISSCQCSVNHYAVHVVKENETLTSISKQYGVSIYAIAAANKNVADMDLVYKGQHLNIPLATKGTQVVSLVINCHPNNIILGEKNWSTILRLPERMLGSFNLSNVPKNFSILCPHFDSHVYSSRYQARTVGYIILLVPLIAFCIKCIAGAIHARASRELREETANDTDVKHHRSGSGRWKSALGDAWGPDLMDTKSMPDSREIKENHSEDEAHIPYEEESRAYEKLERDYQEFLSKCGMSKFGYWRGGTSR